MKKLHLIIFTVNLIISLYSCKKQDNTIQTNNAISVEITKKNHTWYYFNNYTFQHIEKPQLVPAQAEKPWTEAIRISSANNAAEGDSDPLAYAIVNRLGVIKFNNETIFLSPDVNLFNNRTAGNLVFSNNVPVFSVYKSSFFNDSIVDPDYKTDDSAHLFLFLCHGEQLLLSLSKRLIV